MLLRSSRTSALMGLLKRPPHDPRNRNGGNGFCHPLLWSLLWLSVMVDEQLIRRMKWLDRLEREINEETQSHGLAAVAAGQHDVHTHNRSNASSGQTLSLQGQSISDERAHVSVPDVSPTAQQEKGY